MGLKPYLGPWLLVVVFKDYVGDAVGRDEVPWALVTPIGNCNHSGSGGLKKFALRRYWIENVLMLHCHDSILETHASDSETRR